MLSLLFSMYATSAAAFVLITPPKVMSNRMAGPFQQCSHVLPPALRQCTHSLRMQDAGISVDTKTIHADADAVFNVIDSDGDGSVSREELTNHLVSAGYTESAVNAIFSKLDSNADGVLSRDELRAGFVNYSPLRTAPGLGAYNSEFIAEITADADTLFKVFGHRIKHMPTCLPAALALLFLQLSNCQQAFVIVIRTWECSCCPRVPSLSMSITAETFPRRSCACT
jgi:hypothetical protein